MPKRDLGASVGVPLAVGAAGFPNRVVLEGADACCAEEVILPKSDFGVSVGVPLAVVDAGLPKSEFVFPEEGVVPKGDAELLFAKRFVDFWED